MYRVLTGKPVITAFRQVILAAILASACLAVGAGAASASVTNQAALQSQVNAAMPAAKAEVAQATAKGPAALNALAQQVINMPMPAPNATSPQQYALLQALKLKTTVKHSEGVASSLSPPTATTPANNQCWFTGGRHIYERDDFYDGPFHMGFVEKDHGFWCGNGYSITNTGGSQWGYYHMDQSYGPYCQAIVFNQNGWDGPHASWVHGAITAHAGNYTPWTTCVTYQGATEAIRLAANGHWDSYYDF